MRDLIPRSTELAIFAGLAAICAAIVGTLDAQSHDIALAGIAFPIFVFAAVLGLRRNWARQAVATVEVVHPITTTSTQANA
jgi:lysylphosphatidylglycerol synthetase-like protein (DUF2156 family)